MNIPTHFHDHWRGKRDKSCNRVLRTDFAAMVYNKIGLRSISPAPIAMATSPWAIQRELIRRDGWHSRLYTKPEFRTSLPSISCEGVEL